MRSRFAPLAPLVLAACGASAPAARVAPTSPVAAGDVAVLRDPALQPLAFLVGAWQTDDGTVEIWTPAGDALFGVSFSDGGGFECVILSVHEGAVTYRAMPGGQPAVPFVLDATTLADDNARFTNPAHDDPQVVQYTGRGDALEATVSRLDGSNALAFRFTRVALAPAPVLADADRAFAADTARDGSAGWTRWFAPDGAMLRKTERIEGPAAIQALMAPLLDDPGQKLLWAPLASGFAPAGDLGFTVGEAHIVDRGKVTWYGAYVTIWKKQPDGRWRVLFDTGDDDSRRGGDA